MLISLVILSIAPLIIMGKFDPLAFFNSSLSKGASEFNRLKAKTPKNLSSVIADDKVQVYKWRDESGVMQFSNVPPATDRHAERVLLDPNSNLMQATKIPVKEPEKEAPKDVAQTKSPNPYSVKGLKKVMEDVQGVEKLLQQRQGQQQEALNDL